MISTLQYISQTGAKGESHSQMVLRALEAGADWVQLRIKNAAPEIHLAEGILVSEYCFKHNATFIMNDHPELALKCGAHGVHLGKKDGSIEAARDLLGPQKIIGATCNTLADIEMAYKQGANYIGLGPYRFTESKDRLSPVLGIEGYQDLLAQVNLKGISIPIFAIGGIKINDVKEIMKSGVYGIAVASLINQAEDPAKIFKTLKKRINNG